jgi:hypothetical protein
MKTRKWVAVACIISSVSFVGCDRPAPTAPGDNAPVEGVPAAPLSADARLGQAEENVEKAIALLGAAENEGVTKPFGNHRDKAISLLEKARGEIAAAAAYADDPKNN